MAKKPKNVYAPGELSRVRGKLGALDVDEAKRMAKILGGEVGYERSEEEETARKPPKTRREKVELIVKGRASSGRSGRRIDLGEAHESEEQKSSRPASAASKKDVADDPSVRLKMSYLERVKMDRYAALPEFDIKNSLQALISLISVFGDPPDYVNPLFVTKRISEYYRRVEQLVNSTRTLFPRNNAKRGERVKKTSPFVFAILDTIRYWNIERITAEMAKIQSHPRSVKVAEFADILRAVYRPLFILEQLDMELHIRGAYKTLYKVLYIENPAVDQKEKYQEHIRIALSAFSDIRKNVHYLLYPLLMKLLSDRWLPYERFFVERRRRFMAFLKVTEADRIGVPEENVQQTESGNLEAVREDVKKEQEEAAAEPEPVMEEDPDDPAVIERKAREAAREAEQKALDKGLAAMEMLFPKAGWDRLTTFPDLYPYFADTLKLKRGYELLAPTDPMQLTAILMHLIEEFFFAIRYVTFGTVTGSDGNPVRVEDYLGSMINNWQRYISDSFGKDYLPRLSEYCQMLEQSFESRNSAFARRTMNELHWAKRLYYLPYYKFETIGPPPFQKRDTTPIYGEVRLLRKYLTAVAAGIEQGNRLGGANSQAPCDGIDNPWEPYNFEIPNLISMRLDMLLSPGKRNNAALIFFCLSTVVVLDHLLNDESSWAYDGRPGFLFRSVNNEGRIPLFGVETKLDADLIFKMTLKQRQKEREQQKPGISPSTGG
ncbi:MAG TPA: hypothetical protein DEQ14_12255 [Treponema sp.]|nr:hypothetical protein [Treponema sp.]